MGRYYNGSQGNRVGSCGLDSYDSVWDKWLALVNTSMNLEVQYKLGTS
jgi:hypothetical protein